VKRFHYADSHRDQHKALQQIEEGDQQKSRSAFVDALCGATAFPAICISSITESTQAAVFSDYRLLLIQLIGFHSGSRRFRTHLIREMIQDKTKPTEV
jgi:hypothetical protein